MEVRLASLISGFLKARLNFFLIVSEERLLSLAGGSFCLADSLQTLDDLSAADVVARLV